MAPTKGEIFVNESVIVFGFLGGLFTCVGVDLETEILRALMSVLEAFIPSIGPYTPLILILLTLALMISSILTAYNRGGKIGLVAVAMAMTTGFIIIGGSIQSIIGIFIFLASMYLGEFAAENL